MITPTPGGWLVHLGDFDDLFTDIECATVNRVEAAFLSP